VTDDKVVLLAAVAAWLLAGGGGLLAHGDLLAPADLSARADLPARGVLPSRAEWRALAPSLALIVIAIVAALAAPAYSDDALKSVWRLAAAAFVFLLLLRVARDQRCLTGLLWAVAFGAGVSAVIGLGEASGWRALDPVLSLFKVAPTRVGGELRVSASFQYATIAAMYFEMVVPLAIALSATAARRWVRLLGLGIAVVCTANVVLSLTRAGILTLAVIDGALLAAAWLRPTWRKLLPPTLAAAAVLIGGVAILAARNPVFDMRLATEGDADWYGAAYSAPATLQLQADQPATVSVDVHNTGRIAWSSAEKHPFALGYRWLTADGTGALDVPPGEVPLTRDVAPGETIHLETLVAVPNLPAGTYRLDWGMLQRDVLQFYERGWADAETVVDLSQAASGVQPAPPATLPRDDGEAPWVVGRLDLWGAAVRMIEARPWLGVGLDNFRHLYGAELGLDSWDERVQANNVYLELLADLGVIGLAAFVWLVAPVLVNAFRRLRRPDTGARSLWLLGCGLGLVAFLVHGLLDSFVAFTPTALLFWMLLAMAVVLGGAQKPHVSGR
jgi:O-Antigen ligase